MISQYTELSRGTVEREESAPDESTSDRLDSLNAAEELNGWTPLHLAAIGGHLDVVYLLMEAGCDGHVKDKVIFGPAQVNDACKRDL